jgi:quinoprotein dehydrogenase-associated probable ABC transporter substrate-binding protein
MQRKSFLTAAALVSWAASTVLFAQQAGGDRSGTADQQAGARLPATGAAGAPADAAMPPGATGAAGAGASGGGGAGAPGSDDVLRVCADPNNLPQSNNRGEGYENKIAQALARDLKRKKVEYTWFPQRMGFVRNTLRARDENTMQYKCDVIIGVPKGYELTATTQPYMHSTYALVFFAREDLKGLQGAEDLAKLPPDKLHSLRIGLFAKTPAADWVLQNGLMDRAVFYPTQSGDPNETAEMFVERDLEAGKIDAAIMWGPIAGYMVNQHQQHADGKSWVVLPFKPNPAIRFDYEMSMGVRFGEKDWKDTLDSWISGHQAEISKILTSYHIPLLEPSASPAGPSSANRNSASPSG